MISLSDILKAPILIVDDQEPNISLLEQMLEGAGYVSVASTTDPHEVCELHRKNRYSLILLDLQMPGLDGFQVMEGLKAVETDSYIPVLAVTAQSDHKLRALKAGAKDFVSKPFDLAEVLMRVYNMLEVRLLHLEAKESERRFAATFKSVADGLIATDGRGLITCFNPSAESVTGWGLDEAVGTPLSDVFPLFDDGTHEPNTDFFSAFLVPRSVFDSSRTALLRCRSGNEIPVEYRAAHIHDDLQRLNGAVICFRDITDRTRIEANMRRAQEELAQSHAQLLAKHEELQTFYHLVSHEVKTPLTSAREFVSLVLEGLAGPMTPTQTEYLKIAQESCDQMRTCINDMLDVTRLQTGKMKVDLKLGSLGFMVRRVVTVLAPAAERKGIQLTCVLDPGLPEIQMDETRIGQIVTNLLNNALKFTSEKGRIAVGVSRGKEGFLVINVTDTGRGIAKEHLGRLFDRLYQVRPDDAAGCMGLGLGLHICQELTKLHGGNIWVESQEGRGSTFYVELPIANPEQPLRAA